MRIRALTPFLAILALGCAGDSADQAETAENTQEYAAETDADAGAAVAAVGEAWETHYNMGHGSMVADFHASDGMFIPANGSVLQGRAAIAEYLNAEMAEGSPHVSIDTDDTIIEGDWAVARGTYSVEVTPEGGEAMTQTGSWASLDHMVDGEWLIQGLMANYDSPDQAIPGEAPTGAIPTPPADLQIPPGLQQLADAYQTHFNLGHAPMVADLYTEDAVAMIGGAPAVEGRAAIQQGLAARIAAGAGDLAIQPLGFRSLSDDIMVSHGTVSSTMDGAAQQGFYAAVYERGADGAWKIKWVITTNRAPAGM